MANKLKEVKDTVRLWKTSIHASRREKVVITRLYIGHTAMTHQFLIEDVNLLQFRLCRHSVDNQVFSS